MAINNMDYIGGSRGFYQDQMQNQNQLAGVTGKTMAAPYDKQKQAYQQQAQKQQQMAGQAMPPPPTGGTAMNPGPGPYSPYGNNPMQVAPPGYPEYSGGQQPGGGAPPPTGGGNVSAPNMPRPPSLPGMPAPPPLPGMPNQPGLPDQNLQASNQYGGQQIAGSTPSQADYNSVQGYADAAYQNSRRYLDPQQKQQNQRMDQELINQGIDPNSPQGKMKADALARQQADQNNAASFGAMQFGQGIQNQMAQQELANQGLAGQMQQALWQNQTAGRGQDIQHGLGVLGAQMQGRGQDTQFGLGVMGNQMQGRGQDVSFGLGQMQNQLGYAGLQNQANIANQQTGLGYAGLGNQYNIANMQNQTALSGQQNQFDIAKMGNQTQRYGMDLQNEQAMGNLDLARDVSSWNQSQDIWRNQFDTNVHNDNYNLAEMRALQGWIPQAPPTGPISGQPISGGNTSTSGGIG
jgi:hypothetical protein